MRYDLCPPSAIPEQNHRQVNPMSEALAADLTSFDDAPRPGAKPDGNAPAHFGRVLGEAGIEVPGTLFNEALELARDGHLGQAQARLQMLLCLDPDDGDAHLLLAKVHGAQNRWGEALARLDSAVSSGVVPPAGFREGLEAHIRAERGREEEHRARVAARELGELKALRHETRSLRGETIRLEAEVAGHKERERAWKLLAISAGVFGSLVILFLVATPPRTAANTVEAPVAAAPVAAAPVAAAPAVAPAAVVAAPEPAVAEAPAAPVERTHTVKKGETLGKIAARYYGKSSEWQRIAKANPQVGPDGAKLSLGMTLTIPPR